MKDFIKATENEAVLAAEQQSAGGRTVHVYYEFAMSAFMLYASNVRSTRRVYIGEWTDGKMKKAHCLGTWNKFHGVTPLSGY